MGIYRMYTGDDGQTHIEEQSLADHPELANPRAVTNITFTEPGLWQLHRLAPGAAPPVRHLRSGRHRDRRWRRLGAPVRPGGRPAG